MTNDESVDFFCSTCGQKLCAPPELFGQSIACPGCNAPLIVPLAAKDAQAIDSHGGGVPPPPPPPRNVGAPQPPPPPLNVLPPPGGIRPAGHPMSERSEILGYAMLVIAGVTALLIWQSGILGLPPMALSFIAVIGTAILAGVEAKQLGMGGNADLTPKGKKRTGPSSWIAGMLMLWAVAFPMYLYSRSRYGVRNLLLPGIIAAVVFLGACFMAVSALPSVDAPEIVEAAQKALRESPGNKRRGDSLGTITISNPGEVSYDWYHQKRMARAIIKTNLGTEVIYYSVEWQNRSKGISWVQIQSQGDAQRSTTPERTADTVPPAPTGAVGNSSRTNPSGSDGKVTGDAPQKVQSQPAQEQVEGPSESIIRTGVNYMGHMTYDSIKRATTYDSIKRANTVLTSRGLSGPAGTRVYLVRMGDFPMPFSFYQDSFGEWKIQLLNADGVPQGWAWPVANCPKIEIPKNEEERQQLYAKAEAATKGAREEEERKQKQSISKEARDEEERRQQMDSETQAASKKVSISPPPQTPGLPDEQGSNFGKQQGQDDARRQSLRRETEGKLTEVDTKIASEKKRWTNATAVINKLTNYKKTPVQEGTQAYYQCLEASKVIQDVERGADNLKAEKARLETKFKELELK